MQVQQHPLQCSPLGTQRYVTSYHYGPTDAARKIYIQASLHADELPGMLVAHHLRERLEQLEQAGQLAAQVVVVPVANPIGLSQWMLHAHIGRFDLNSGHNFNRHYPQLAALIKEQLTDVLGPDAATNTRAIRQYMRQALSQLTPTSEVESLRQVLLGLACDADIVLDLHCDSEADMHLYTGTPLWPQVEPLARLLGAVATLLEVESGEEPFDEACSSPWWLLQLSFPDKAIALGCTAITVELRGAIDVNHDYAQRDAQAILKYLQHTGDIAACETISLPPLIADATPLSGSEPLMAPVSGVLAYTQPLGHRIHAGDVVAHVIDPLNGQTHEVKATTTGVFYARENRRFTTAGMRIGKIAGAQPYRSGPLLSA